MTKIYLSPSDQTDNIYACGGTTEAEQCRKIANACEITLKRCGFDVKNGQSGSYVKRTNESNVWNADLHLCIHTNAFNGKTDGLRMFYYNEGGPSYKACKSIYDVLVKIVPGTSSNMKANQELYEMYYTNCASVYCEVSFHDVYSTSQWIVSHTNEIANAIVQGVCNYYGVSYNIGSQSSGEMYRIRKSWADAKSQIGAYKNLENAKNACKDGYSVFNSAGECVYSKAAKSVEEIAKEVISGKWGNGADRRSRLTAAGYNYDEVQSCVNKLLTPSKSIDELAREVIAGKWGNGADRKAKLVAAGYDYNAVQKRVNELL